MCFCDSDKNNIHAMVAYIPYSMSPGYVQVEDN